MNKLEVFDSNGKTIVTCYFFAILSIKLKRDIKRNYFCLETMNNGLPKTRLELFTNPENPWILISETAYGPISKKNTHFPKFMDVAIGWPLSHI